MSAWLSGSHISGYMSAESISQGYGLVWLEVNWTG